ncbi:MAG: hypothetical protein LBN07_01450 [Christensenellaceae bacterium]|jgi:hypothetical protein|nr:hypothetical protein [Christensenellaceae bacterium]
MINILKKSLFSVTMLILTAGLVFGLVLANGGFLGSTGNRNQQVAGAHVPITPPSAPVVSGTWLEQLNFVNSVDTNNVINASGPNLNSMGAPGTARGTTGDYSDGFDFTKGNTVSGNPGFTGGIGIIIPGDPYIISNAYQLSYLAYMVNNGYNNFSGKEFKLGNNIDLTGHRWVAIGNYKSFNKDGGGVYSYCGFDGIFDGNNKTISGLAILSNYTAQYGYATTTTNSSYSFNIYEGLFGYVGYNNFQGTQIKDLTLDAPYISVSSDIDFRSNYSSNYLYLYNNIYAGAIAGYYYGEGIVSNVNVVDPYITTSSNNKADSMYATSSTMYVYNYDYAYIGGLFGDYQGGDGITDCHVSGNALIEQGSGQLTASSSGYPTRTKYPYCYSYSYVGGLFGQGYFNSYYNNAEDYFAELTDCSVNAEIHGGYYVGGIGGYVSGDWYNHLNTQNLTFNGYIDDQVTYTTLPTQTNTSNSSYLGGIFGYVSEYVNMIDVHNYGEINATKGYYVGGLAGYFYHYDYDQGRPNVSIIDSTNEGAVSSINVNGNSGYTGGLVGYIDSYYAAVQVKNCQNLGTVTARYGQIGGLIGYFYAWNDYIAVETASIDNCENQGNVEAVSGGYIYYLGGLVGYAGGIIIKDSVNSASITNLSSSSNYIGGLIGQVDSVTLLNSHNEGNIAAGNSSYVGGVMGYIYDNGNNIVNKIENVYNTGNITGSGSINYVGGVAGYVSNYTLEGVKNFGNITLTSSSNYVGGVVGRLERATLYNSFNTGSVTAGNYVGGVAGEIYGDTTTISVVRMCYNTGFVGGLGTYTGGIVGRAYYGALIEDCYNTYGGYGNTAGVVNTLNGGIVGGIYTHTHMEVDVIVRNCYNDVNVGQSLNNYVGAIVGTVEYQYYSSATQSLNQQKKVLIENCYSRGIAYKTTSSTSRIGGAIGRVNYGNNGKYATVEVKNSFWNKDTPSTLPAPGSTLTGLTAANNFANANVGYVNYANSTYINTIVTVYGVADQTTGAPALAAKTETALKDVATYPVFNGNSGWNFGEVIVGNNLLGVWLIDQTGTINDGYPMLRSWAQAVLSFYANGQVVHLYDNKGDTIDISSANAIAASAKIGYLFSGWKSYDDYTVGGFEYYVKNDLYEFPADIFKIADRSARFDATYTTKAKYEIEFMTTPSASVRNSGGTTVDSYIEIGTSQGQKMLHTSAYSNQLQFEAIAYWAVYNPTSGNWDILGRYLDLDLSFIIPDNNNGVSFINTYVQYGAGTVGGFDTVGTIQIKLVEISVGTTPIGATFYSNIAGAGYITVNGTIVTLGAAGNDYPEGSIVTVVAHANAHYRFVGFLIGSSDMGGNSEMSLIAGTSFANGDEITAVFERIEYLITIVEEENGTALGVSSGLIAYSAPDVSIGDTSTVWLSATEQNTSYRFISWAIYNYSTNSYETLLGGALFGDYNAAINSNWINTYVREGSAKIVARVVAIREVSMGLNETDQSKGYSLGNIEIIDEEFPELSLEASGSVNGAFATTGSTLRFTLDQIDENARYYELEGVYTAIGNNPVSFVQEGDWYVVTIEGNTNIYVRLTYKAFNIDFIAADTDGNEIRLGETFSPIGITAKVGTVLLGSVVGNTTAPVIQGYRWTDSFYLKDGSGNLTPIPQSGSVVLDLNDITNNIAYVGGSDVFQIVGQYIKTYRLSVAVSGDIGSGTHNIKVNSTGSWIEPTSDQLANGFDRGTQIKISVASANYYGFVGFGGVDAGEIVSGDAVITLDSNRNISVRFSATEYTLGGNIVKNGSGEVTVNKQKARIGETVTIVASPADGQDIVTFKIGGVDVLGGNLPLNMTYNNGILTLTLTTEWANAHGFDLDGEIGFAQNPTVLIIIAAAAGGVLIAAVLVLIFLLNYNKKRKFIKAQLMAEQAANYKLNTGSFIQDLREGKNVGQVTDEDIKKAMKDRKGKK